MVVVGLTTVVAGALVVVGSPEDCGTPGLIGLLEVEVLERRLTGGGRGGRDAAQRQRPGNDPRENRPSGHSLSAPKRVPAPSPASRARRDMAARRLTSSSW